MTHAHHPHPEPAGAALTSERTRWLLAGVVGLVTVAALIGVVVLRPEPERPPLSAELGFPPEIVDASVTDVREVPCAGTVEADGIRCDEIRFDVTSGSTKGDQGSFEVSVIERNVSIDAGDRITLGFDPEADPAFQYRFSDFHRRTPLLWLAALFGLSVIALGRLQGVRALLALAITGVVVVAFMFPSILDGNDPTAVAIVSAALIAVAALYITHGVTEMITVALLGTFAALALTAVLAAVFANLAGFTGFGSEDAFYLQFASVEIDVRGLVLAGIILGSLGVLDDVTVTQVSAVWQLHEANPQWSARRLYRSGVTIGRDHIASTVNTLVLAYAGASLPLLLLFTQAGRSLGDVVVSELVAVEVVRTLVGSIGLVAAVPATTALAAFVVTRGSVLASQGRVPRPPTPPLPPPPPSPVEPPAWDQFAPEEGRW